MTLQEYWNDGCLPGIQGITFSNGNTLIINESICLNSYSFEESTIVEDEDEFGDISVQVDVYEKVFHSSSGGYICCGECEMGNQGFVLFENSEGILQWSIFQEFANPFVTINIIESEIVHAVTEIQYEWKIPILNPKELSCVSKNPWGY